MWLPFVLNEIHLTLNILGKFHVDYQSRGLNV